MNKFESTSLGGIPETWDDERFYLDGIYKSFNDMFRSYGNDLITQGCVVDLTIPTAATMTAGLIVLGSELLRVDAQTFDSTTIQYFTKVITNDSTGLKQLQSGGTANTYKQNRV